MTHLRKMMLEEDLMQISPQRNSYKVSRNKSGDGNLQKEPCSNRNCLSVESVLLLDKEDFDDSNTQ